MKNANKIVQYVNNIIGDIMHNIKINDNLIRTDLLLEQKKGKIKTNESYAAKFVSKKPIKYFIKI